MFRLHKTSPDGLLTSRLFDEQSFYQSLLNDLKHSRSEVIIESPYMTLTRCSNLLPTLRKLAKHGVKIRVNTRLPEHHDTLLRIEAYKATKALKNSGVRVWYYNDHHHRKIAVIDNKILWEGSLNILSQNNSKEIMRRIESGDLALQMTKFLRLKRTY